jgi:hypothetical protein
MRSAIGLANPNLDTQLSSIAGYLDTEITSILAAVDTEIASIKSKTDNLPADPADASDIATSFSNITTLLNTLTSYVDTEIASIKSKTDNLPADPASNTQVNTRLASSSYIIPDNATITAIKVKTDNLPALPASVTDIPNAATIASAVWASTVEGTLTALQIMRLLLALLAGKKNVTDNGNGTVTIRFRNIADDKNRLTGTINNTTGVRTDTSNDPS